MAEGGELNFKVNLTNIKEELQAATIALQLTIAEFNRVWAPIEEFIGSLTWEEVQTVFPDADLIILWGLWETAADKYQSREDENGTL